MKTLPRVKLAMLPTALEEAPRLCKELDITLFVKRDDNTGLALGGNKARKLEYLVGEAVELGADTLITTGAPQSNHCRMTAAAAAKVGLACHLVLNGTALTVKQGNLLLDELLGAKVHFLGSDDASLAPARMQGLNDELTARGARPYLVPLGGSSPVGAVAYVMAIEELLTQSCGQNFDYIVHASGSAGTQAGLLAGVKSFGLPTRVIGISVSRPQVRLAREVLELCRDTLTHAGAEIRVEEDDVIVYDEYVGRGYGLPTEASTSALELFARREGIILDPVYTAKAAAGLIDLVRRGTIPAHSRVLFWHTGGMPALFADLAPHWGEKA
ncbi:MAG: L-cysteate sulfo-lyase [Firmicutes bacterium]|nr:L-cysteate sulfo-lyase [candidate division NPL-UPA2 bacterium]